MFYTRNSLETLEDRVLTEKKNDGSRIFDCIWYKNNGCFLFAKLTLVKFANLD